MAETRGLLLSPEVNVPGRRINDPEDRTGDYA
jgi:hypothetical protein